MAEKRRPGRTSSTSEGVDPLAGSHPRRGPAAFRTGADAAGTGAAPPPADDAELDRRDRRQSRKRKAPGPDKTGTAPQPTRRRPADPPPSDPAPAED